jgi:hypothetical protein
MVQLRKFESLSIVKVGEVSIGMHDLYREFAQYEMERECLRHDLDREILDSNLEGERLLHDLHRECAHHVFKGAGLGGGRGSPPRINPAMRYHLRLSVLAYHVSMYYIVED